MKKYLLFPLIFVLLAGCKGNLQPDTVHVLNMAATVAKERASSFKVIKSELAPVSETFKEDFDRFVAAHQVSLDATATALETLRKAVALNAKFNKQTRKMIQEAIKTEAQRLKLVDHWRKTVKATDEAKQVEVISWLEAHYQTIVRQVQLMQQLSDKIERDNKDDDKQADESGATDKDGDGQADPEIKSA